MSFKPKMQDNCRKRIDLDWKKIDELLLAGCKGADIAKYFGIHDDTLKNAALRDFGLTWRLYCKKKKQQWFYDRTTCN